MSIRKQLQRVLVEKESKALRQVFCVTGASGIDFSQLQEASLSQFEVMLSDWLHSAEVNLKDGVLPQKILYVARTFFDQDEDSQDFYKAAMFSIRELIRGVRNTKASFKEYNTQEEQLLARIKLAVFVRDAVISFSANNRKLLDEASDVFTEEQLAIVFNCELASVKRKTVEAQVALLAKVASFVYSPEPEVLVGAEKEFFEHYERLSDKIDKIFSIAIEKDFMPVKVRFSGEGNPDEFGLTEQEWHSVLDIHMY